MSHMLEWDVSSVPVRGFWICLAIAAFVAQHARLSSQNPTPAKGGSHARNKRVSLALVAVTVLGLGWFFWRSRGLVRARQEKDGSYARAEDATIAMASFSLVTLSRLLVLPAVESLGRVMVAAHHEGAQREQRAQRFAGQVWKALYHATATIVPLIILRDEAWWPPALGEARMVWDQYPLVPPVKWLREFYMFQLGYYLHATHVTLMQDSRANQLSMTVHHMATVSLVMVSYFVENTIRFGTLVFWVHDVCDVPVCLTRIFVDLSMTVPTAVCYVTLMTLWATFRLFVYPVYVFKNVAWDCLRHGWVQKSDAVGWGITTPLLALLAVMHWIWFFELLGMARVYLKSGKAIDSTEDRTPPGPLPEQRQLHG